MRPPQTRYARAPDGAAIAYQTFGSGPLDIVLATNWIWSIDLMWDLPMIERALLRLADLGRVVVFDKRGNGSSDPLRIEGEAQIGGVIEQSAHDLVTVLDEVGSTSACLIGADLGGWVAMLAAATHPERTQSLVLQDSCARFIRADDYPAGMPQSALSTFLQMLPERWGSGWSAEPYTPRLVRDPAFLEWYGRFERLSMPPSKMLQAWSDMRHMDIRSVLPSIRVPTLLLAHEEAVWVRAAHSRYLAEQIPDAELVTLPGADIFFGADDRVADEISRFVAGSTGDRNPRYADRVLAAVLFTDLVASTERLVEMGDGRWRALLDEHDAIVRRHVARHSGRLVKNTGDGALATFSGPARAVHAAMAIREEVTRLGVEIRSGIHTGEIELRGDDVGGVAVHLAARVMDVASAGEIVVSRTVKDLATGAGLTLEDRGEHRLKGIDEPWRLYRVDA